jgi:DNA-binding NtrC family response regulator
MKKNIYPLIFIVEDNIAFRKIVVHLLTSNGYNNVIVYSSGEECLKNINLKPNIIIQDYKLQGISGLNVLQRVKKVLPLCEFVFLSGQDNVDIAVNTMKLGAFDYIVKNETALQRLIQIVDNIVRLQKLNKRNRRYILFTYFMLIILAFILITLFFSSDVYFF